MSVSRLLTISAVVVVLAFYAFVGSDGRMTFPLVSWQESHYASLSEGFLRGQLNMAHEASPSLVRILDGLNDSLPDLPDEVRSERYDMARQLLVHMIAERERALAENTPTPRATWHDAASGLIDALVGLWLAPVTKDS